LLAPDFAENAVHFVGRTVLTTWTPARISSAQAHAIFCFQRETPGKSSGAATRNIVRMLTVW